MPTFAAATPDPMAGFRTLGRLLAVGIAAGGVIGGFVGGVAAWSPSSPGDSVGGLSIGTVLGMVLGLITQAVTHALVLAARAARRPSTTHASGLGVAAAVPLTAVAALSFWIAQIAADTTGKSVVIVGGATTLAAITVMLSSRWSLSPLGENFGGGHRR
jgi:hypothetical protein